MTFVFAAVCLIYFGLLWFDAAPLLRGPGEQSVEWSYFFQPKPIPARIIVALAAAAGILGLLAIPAGRLSTKKFLSSASLLGFVWWISLLGLKSQGAAHALVEDTLSPTFTSYLGVAMREEAASPLDYMRRHHELLLTYRSDSLHASTHPPGPVLFYRAVYGLVRTVPGMAGAGAAAVRRLTGEAWRDAPGPDPDASLASALLAGSLVMALGAAAVWPLFWLARAAGVSVAAARRLGLLWVLTPGPALMAPEFDQALAFIITGAACALMWTLRAGDTRGALLRGAAAGALAAFCMELTYGAGPFLVLAGLGAAAWAWGAPEGGPEIGTEGGAARDRRIDFAALGAATAFLLVFAGLYALGRRPVASFLIGMINHQRWVGNRSYSLWLMFNPLEFLVFFGPPTVMAGAPAWMGRRGLRGRATRRFKAGCLVGLAGLVASGTSPGEVGRIWIPLMPLFLVVALGNGEPEGEGAEAPSAPTSLWLACALAALCIVMRLRWNLP